MNYINFLDKNMELDKSQMVTLIDRLLYKYVAAEDRDIYLSFFNGMVNAGVFTDEENPIDLDSLLANYCASSFVVSPADVFYGIVADAYADGKRIITEQDGSFFGRIEKVSSSCCDSHYNVLCFLVSCIEDLNEFDEQVGITIDFRN